MRDLSRLHRSLQAAALASCVASVGCASSAVLSATPQQSRTLVQTSATAGGDIELFRDTRRTAHVVSAPPADVWKVLGAAYADLGLTGGGPAIGYEQTYAAVIPALRRQLNKVPLSRLLDCGTTATGQPGAEAHAVRLQVTTVVEPEGTGARLRSQVLARATSTDNSNGAQECASTGVLEQRLAQAVDARLGTP
jgi:hypothetical protein